MKWHSVFRFAVGILLLLSISGCGGGSEIDLYEVTGTVKYEGTPVADGEIRLISEDGQRIDAGRITNGEYRVQTTEGKKRVEITATREDPKTMIESAIEPGKMIPSTEMYIPEKYNTKSELTANVTAGEPSTADFPLEP